MTKETLFPTDETVAEQTEVFKSYGLKYYTPFEEILNAITHGIGLVWGIVGMVFLLLKSTTPSSIATSVLVSFGFIVLYGCSTAYHMITNLKLKSVIRRLDHSSVNFVIISCGVSVCLLTSNSVYNYVALALCYAVTAANFVMCFIDLDRFKAPSFISNLLTSVLLTTVFIVNRTYFTTEIKLWFAFGCVLCLIGAILFGIKKRYMHAVFHVFTLAGTIVFYFTTLSLLS